MSISYKLRPPPPHPRRHLRLPTPVRRASNLRSASTKCQVPIRGSAFAELGPKAPRHRPRPELHFARGWSGSPSSSLHFGPSAGAGPELSGFPCPFVGSASLHGRIVLSRMPMVLLWSLVAHSAPSPNTPQRGARLNELDAARGNE
jgi:hypothetical protein